MYLNSLPPQVDLTYQKIKIICNELLSTAALFTLPNCHVITFKNTHAYGDIKYIKIETHADLKIMHEEADSTQVVYLANPGCCKFH